MHGAKILKCGDDGETTDERKEQRKENCMHEICTCIKARNTSDFRLCYVTCEQTIEPLPSFILYQ